MFLSFLYVLVEHKRNNRMVKIRQCFDLFTLLLSCSKFYDVIWISTSLFANSQYQLQGIANGGIDKSLCWSCQQPRANRSKKTETQGKSVMTTAKGIRKGGWFGVKTPLELDILCKLYNLRKWDSLFLHTFLLLICRLNANTTEQICMQISRNIVNGLKE